MWIETPASSVVIESAGFTRERSRVWIETLKASILYVPNKCFTRERSRVWIETIPCRPNCDRLGELHPGAISGVD